jgi:NDP-sugar pyrophosphorylase family protein
MSQILTRVGIVLAGGESTRLPMKALAPISASKLAVESSIDFLNRSGCDVLRRIVIVSPYNNTVISHVLKQRGHKYNYINQSRGVSTATGAMLEAWRQYPADEYLITFCDNIYPDSWTVGPSHSSRAEISALYSPNPQLDRVGSDDKIRRRGTGFDHMPAFAGYALLSSLFISKVANEVNGKTPFIDLLNMFDLLVRPMQHKGWHDIGTPESYFTYLKEILL